MMQTISAFLTGHLGVVVYLVLAFTYIVYVLGPWNWRYIKNRWTGGIIRLEKAEKELLGEGPVLIKRPFERLVKVPLFDLKIGIRLPDQPTAAPNTQNVHIYLLLVIRFADPIKVILSVPDRDPIDEFKDFVRAAVRAAVQMMTVVELSAKGGGNVLVSMIRNNLENEPILKRWGLEIVSLNVKDINLSKSFIKAQDEIIEAEGTSQATRIKATAQKDAADELGRADTKGLAAMLVTQQQRAQVDTAKAGGIRTFVQLADDALGKFFKSL
jgi:regulator of protease activity HflC (stomatin/prohibitin superfamily)